MHMFHIPQFSIQNRNVHISVLNGVLWDMEQVHSGIWEISLLVDKFVGQGEARFSPLNTDKL